MIFLIIITVAISLLYITSLTAASIRTVVEGSDAGFTYLMGVMFTSFVWSLWLSICYF